MLGAQVKEPALAAIMFISAIDMFLNVVSVLGIAGGMKIPFFSDMICTSSLLSDDVDSVLKGEEGGFRVLLLSWVTSFWLFTDT